MPGDTMQGLDRMVAMIKALKPGDRLVLYGAGMRRQEVDGFQRDRNQGSVEVVAGGRIGIENFCSH